MILSSFCTNDGNDEFTESAQPAVCCLSRVVKGFCFLFSPFSGSAVTTVITLTGVRRVQCIELTRRKVYNVGFLRRSLKVTHIKYRVCSNVKRKKYIHEMQIPKKFLRINITRSKLFPLRPSSPRAQNKYIAHTKVTNQRVYRSTL